MTRAVEFRLERPDAPSPAASRAAEAGSPSTVRRLHVMMATPLGAGGRGGMDRLTDLVIDEIEATHHAGSVAITRLTTKGGRGRLWAVPVFALAVARFAALSLRGRVDVLHLNLAADGSFTRKAVLAGMARRLSIPYVVHIHTGRFEKFWSSVSPRRRARIDRLMREAARIIVLGGVFKDMVTAHVPEAADRTVILPNATPERPRARSADPDQPVRIAYLGVLAATKGVPQLIEALGRIGASTPWSATLAGYGDITGTRACAVERGIADRIATPGWVSPQDVDALLAQTDILVLPSFSEGLPMSIIEAFAAGVPVIATPVGATVDVVQDGVNGLLVPPGDAKALSKALSRLIADPQLRRTMGEAAAAEHALRFKPEPYVAALAGIWQTAAVRR